MIREWFTAKELAELALPALPTTERGVQIVALQQHWRQPEAEGETWRARAGRGGGVEYHFSLLHTSAKAKLTLLFGEKHAAPRPRIAAEGAWAWFDRLPETKKAKARTKLDALDAVEALVSTGTGRSVAMQVVAGLRDVSLRTLYTWAEAVAGLPRADWLPVLAPRHAGAASVEAECAPDAWEYLKADFLRPERPNITDCLRRLRQTAEAKGWALPSDRTLHRRLLALPETVRVLARDGAEALRRMYPAQQRDRSIFHALEAVNADGHKWDVFVRWPDGTVGRPVMVAFQDLYSGRILAWRVDRTENKEAVRLAFGDVVEGFGIPDHCWLDNGRNFASKWLTGGTPTRYRFKIRDDEPHGIMTQLGVQVHWTQPYSGQSKPIERAFLDLAQGLAKHPAFAGAYVGNTPMAKPANYGSKAVPIDRFLQVIAAGIAEHNARPGRNTAICQRRLSFIDAFDASYQQAPIRRATAEQRRLWLMAAEGVTARTQDGSIHFEGNRYWSEFLVSQRGRKLVIRFDPQALQDDLHVYGLDGAYLGSAPCIEAEGFADADAARRHAAQRRAWLNGQRQMLDAERSMTIDQVAELLPQLAPEPDAPERSVIRPLFRGATALKQRPIEQEDEDPNAQLTRAIFHAHGRPVLRAVPDSEDE